MQKLTINTKIIFDKGIDFTITISFIPNNWTTRMCKMNANLMCTTSLNLAFQKRKNLIANIEFTKCFIMSNRPLSIRRNYNLCFIFSVFAAQKLSINSIARFWHFPNNNGMINFFDFMILKFGKKFFKNIFLKCNNKTSTRVTINTMN